LFGEIYSWFGRKERSGNEWNAKREWLGGNTHFFHFPQKFYISFPSKWEEWNGMRV
jgi:hypothetical protein